MKTIGIIGGMGPMATVDLYKKITLHTKAERDQDQIHVIIDSNAQIPDRTGFILGGGENPLPELARSARRLELAGADFLIIPCNTSHYFFHDICEQVRIPILNLPELTVRWIHGRYGKGTKVGVLATDGTLASGIYEKYLQKEGMELVKPENNQQLVMAYIYEGIKKNDLSYDTAGLKMAIEEMELAGATAFILGCTEFSAVSQLSLFDERFADPLDILAIESVISAGAALA